MTKAEKVADRIREMRPSELLTQNLVDLIQSVYEEGVREGRATQAIYEAQGRQHFKDLLSKKKESGA